MGKPDFVFLNGQIVPLADAKISVLDRSFLYGDGIFESIRIERGLPAFWSHHWSRLKQGAAFLKITTPFSESDVESAVWELVRRNELQTGVVRITLSRGIGHRGYSPRGADSPFLVMTSHAMAAVDLARPAQWRLMTSRVRLHSNNPFAEIKSCNKLPQVLARAEADAENADEALLSLDNGEIVEGSSSNLFCIEHGAVWTPPLAGAGLAGITRSTVISLCKNLSIPCAERSCWIDTLYRADGVFLTLSSWGVVEAIELNGRTLHTSPITEKLHRGYQALVQGNESSYGVATVDGTGPV